MIEVAVLGVGGVGGYFGGVLVRNHVRVHVVARGRNLHAIRKDGLRVESGGDSFCVRPASVEPDPRAVPRCDFVLLCVKSYDLDSVLAELKPFAGERASFVPLLNGVDAAEALEAEFGKRALPAQCSVLAELLAPGIVRQSPGPTQIVVGERAGGESARTACLAKAFATTGVDVVVSNDITSELWIKLIYISCISSVVAVTRTSVGEVLSCPESRALSISAIEEARAVAAAEGAALPGSLTETLLSRAAALDPQTRFSLLRDVEGGRRLEVEALNGAVVRRGERHGIATPTHRFLYGALLPAHRRASSHSASPSFGTR